MKLAILALCAFQASAFAPQTSFSRNTALSLSSSESYLGNLKQQNGRGAPPGNRVNALEKDLENRLASLAQQEKALENRLRSIDRPGGPASPYGTPYAPNPAALQTGNIINRIWETSQPTTVQGGSLRTWSFANPATERVHVLLRTDGRPLDADVDLWQGPDNTPQRMKVYVEDGGARTFSTFIATPRSPNTIAIRNTGHLEFPLAACVGADREAGDSCYRVAESKKGEIIQGGALRTYAYDPTVDSVVVMIRTDGRPLNARIELLQGPNNNKQVLELYTEDGLDRPFLAIIQTPGSGNVVRIVNTAPVEFPMTCTVEAFETGKGEGWAKDGVMVGREW